MAYEERKNINDAVHIVYASDDKFSEILGVSLISLFESNEGQEKIMVYIMDGGISFENKRKIEVVCFNYHRPLPVWIKAKNISEELKMEIQIDRGSISQYARLFVSSILPEDLERVLYLDCDTLICQPLKELWNLDMHGKTIAALSDAFSKGYRANIGLKPNDIMFNSGVLLINLKLWKSQQIEKKLLYFIRERKGKIQQGDQGALNAVLSKETYCFEPRFNAVTIFFDFPYKHMIMYRKPPKFYQEIDINKAITNPLIVHFTTSFKSVRPWIEGCQHKYRDRWLYYYFMSPWGDSPLWHDSKPMWKKVVVAVYNNLPSVISVPMAGLLQAYIRPFYNLFKYRR